jgi:DNA (cytosine-5)-methyltransferase 1
MNEPKFIIIDLFCGAGGTTTGFAMASNGVAKVIACVNHDAKAIESHWKNHPEVKHFEEDIRTLDLTELAMLAKDYQERYPNAKLILWASLECTNFSKAKGGQPRDADSRTLADHLHRYVDILQPDYVQIENVVEFMSWGPLDDNGKPVSRKNGSDWMRWCREMCSQGYLNEWKELNSADFGAYTSRNRLFGIFARPDLPICWPEPTHSKKPGTGMFEGLKKWMAVKEVLNVEDEGESIFTRKKPLSEKTLERIYAGLVKYIAKGDKAFISKYFSGRPKGKVNSVNDPGPTNTTFGGNSLVQAKSFSDLSIDQPAGSVTTIDHHALVQAEFLLKYNSTNGKTGKHIPPSVEDPAPVISTQGRMGVVQAKFLSAYYGNGDNTSSVEDPCPVVPTKDRFGLVEAVPFIMPTSYDNGPKSVEEPAPTIQASRRHHYIVNPSHGGHCTSIDAPCPVVIARQDKAPLYVVQVENGNVAIAVYETDSECMIRIKQFMAIYSLVDIKMRMLRVLELLKIQGFPDQYVLCGNQSDQKKFIGNSVVPLVVKVWIEALANRLSELDKKVA